MMTTTEEILQEIFPPVREIEGGQYVDDETFARWQNKPEKSVTRPALPASRMRKLDLAAMRVTVPPPIPWVLEPLCARGNVTLLSGREGTGKSFIAFAAAGAVAAGRKLAELCPGVPLVQRPPTVLYFDAENDQNTIHNRVHLLGIPEGVSAYDPQGSSLGRDLASYEDAVIAERPILMVVDSLRSNWPEGDENSSAVAESFLADLRRLARKYDLAILVLHHDGKQSSAGYRGSTALGAGVEIVCNLQVDDHDDAVRILSWQKLRMRETPRPMRLRFRSYGAQLHITTDAGMDYYPWYEGDALNG